MARKPRSRDVPSPHSDWVEWGGERIFAVDFTAGGAPIGPTEDELDGEPDASYVRVNWADAKDVLLELLRGAGAPNGAPIGRIRVIGEGLTNVVYGATIELVAGQQEAVVVKLPSSMATRDRDGRVSTEAVLLRYLCRQPLPFKVPRPLGEIPTPAGLGVVQEWVDGLPVDLRAARFPGGQPWELVARVAAAVHAVNAEPLRASIRGHVTRQDHTLDCVSVMNGLDEPEAKDTEAWMREHLPPTTPSSLLHGDLLGQNLLRPWEGEDVAVIDWADARLGDPAYDLAIVTRGTRKPFAVADGLLRLLDAYNRFAETTLLVHDVRIHELMLAARFYRAAVTGYGMGSPHAENERGVWRGLLKRAAH